METDLEYVIRKLDDPLTRLAEVARQTGISGQALIAIRDGLTKKPSPRTLAPLVALFRGMAE